MSDPLSSDPRVFVLGSLVGSWRILELHDFGSFGAIYRVERAGHPEAGIFALKIALKPEDPRFQREVRLLQRVVHPSVPRFEDSGEWIGPDGRSFPYVVMEWVQGRLLYGWARARQPTSREVLQVLAQLASALAVVHADDGVHRDVKGDNILVTLQGRAVLLDWGAGTYEGAKALTDTMLPPGTANYRTLEAVRWVWDHRMTGEPYQGGPPDDVYALGVTGYRLCTGTYPPAPEVGSGPQPRLLAPRELATVSLGLERLLLACLADNQKARPSAATLATALSAAAKEKDATKPIVPTPAAADTERASRPGPRRRFVVPAWLSVGAAAVAGGLVVLASSKLLYRKLNAPAISEPFPDRAEYVHEMPSHEAPDGGIGEESLASAVQAPRTGGPASVLGLPMRSEPFPWQKKPPCVPESQKAINGGCWWGPLGTKKPPCGPEAFDYDDACYLPVHDGQRQPTSEDPQ